MTNGNGGYATILNGGVGYTEVTMLFKSQKNHRFEFAVNIYGIIN